MRSISIVRKIDHLGRIAIPFEVRKTFQLREREKIEILVEENRIVLKKYQPYRVCLVTGDVLPENTEYAPGLFLSPKGAAILLEHLTKSSISQP